MDADTDIYNACIDIILHYWLSIPEYLYKRSKSMHTKVKVIETTSFCQAISHKTWFWDNQGFFFSKFKLLRTLLAESMLGKMKWTTVIFVILYISAMCTDKSKTYDIMIGLRQLQCMCKAEKDTIKWQSCNWWFLCWTDCCSQSKKYRKLNFALFERQLIMVYNQYKQALNYYAGNL